MIHINPLYPRLGNSLWQIAAAITLADENNDVVNFKGWEQAKYFNGDFSSQTDDTPVYSYNEPYFHYAKIPYSRNLSLNGYFQSYKYFESNIRKIKKVLTVKDEYKYDKIQKVMYNDTKVKGSSISCNKSFESVAVHVRRGDYLNLPNHHPVLSIDYYKLAILAIELQLVNNVKFYIFSDDKPWCRENFKKDNIEVVDTKNEIESFSAMCSCKHFIIANSSYSLMAAYLSQDKDSIVIAPKENWFGSALSFHNLKDLLPKEWIKL